MKKFIHDFQIIANRRVNNDYFVLSLSGKQQLPEIKPGQFVQVRVDNSQNTFLRRPFSVYDVDYEQNILYLLIQIVGEGTRVLSELKNEEKLNLVYPLGNSFSLPDGKKALLIGGGVGIAPLMLLGRWLKEQKRSLFSFLGFVIPDWLLILIFLISLEKFILQQMMAVQVKKELLQSILFCIMYRVISVWFIHADLRL